MKFSADERFQRHCEKRLFFFLLHRTLIISTSPPRTQARPPPLLPGPRRDLPGRGHRWAGGSAGQENEARMRLPSLVFMSFVTVHTVVHTCTYVHWNDWQHFWCQMFPQCTYFRQCSPMADELRVPYHLLDNLRHFPPSSSPPLPPPRSLAPWYYVRRTAAHTRRREGGEGEREGDIGI